MCIFFGVSEKRYKIAIRAPELKKEKEETITKLAEAEKQINELKYDN